MDRKDMSYVNHYISGTFNYCSHYKFSFSIITLRISKYNERVDYRLIYPLIIFIANKINMCYSNIAIIHRSWFKWTNRIIPLIQKSLM